MYFKHFQHLAFRCASKSLISILEFKNDYYVISATDLATVICLGFIEFEYQAPTEERPFQGDISHLRMSSNLIYPEI